MLSVSLCPTTQHFIVHAKHLGSSNKDRMAPTSNFETTREGNRLGFCSYKFVNKQAAMAAFFSMGTHWLRMLCSIVSFFSLPGKIVVELGRRADSDKKFADAFISFVVDNSSRPAYSGRFSAEVDQPSSKAAMRCACVQQLKHLLCIA